MRIRQRVEFGISSTKTTAAEMATRIGIEPDIVSIKGSRITEPPIPRWNTWRILCEETGLNVGEQVANVLSRIRSQKAQIMAMVSEFEGETPCGGALLSIVRYFNDSDGENAEWGVIESDMGIEVARGPLSHQLLGWTMNTDDLGFLFDIGAGVWVDEYDYGDNPEDNDSTM